MRSAFFAFMKNKTLKMIQSSVLTQRDVWIFEYMVEDYQKMFDHKTISIFQSIYLFQNLRKEIQDKNHFDIDFDVFNHVRRLKYEDRE